MSVGAESSLAKIADAHEAAEAAHDAAGVAKTFAADGVLDLTRGKTRHHRPG